MALASINYHPSHLPLLPPTRNPISLHLLQVQYNFPAPQISDTPFCISLSHEVLKYQELAFQCIDRGTSSEASYYTFASSLEVPECW